MCVQCEYEDICGMEQLPVSGILLEIPNSKLGTWFRCDGNA